MRARALAAVTAAALWAAAWGSASGAPSRDVPHLGPAAGVRAGAGLGRARPVWPRAALGVGVAAQAPEEVEAALALDRPTRQLIQRGLQNEGFDAGVPDGVFGPRTRTAIRRWQAERDAPASGYLDAIQAAVLRDAGRAPAVAEPAARAPAVADPAVRAPAVADPAARAPAVAEPAVRAPAVADPAARAPSRTGRGRVDVDRIARAVVRIVAVQGGAGVGSGSGTLVAPDGLIYTNRHVVDGADDYRVEILEDANEPPVPRYRARLVGYSLDVDFAVLRIDRDARGRRVAANRIDLPYVAALADDVQRGDEISVFGYPGLGEGYLTLTEGAITTIRNGDLNGRRIPMWYQTDAQMTPGNSGGLAMNARGEMVGIPTTVRMEDRTGGRLGGLLSVHAVRAALDAGLETDLSRIATATGGPLDGDALDVNGAPTYGAVTLAAGFSPDPHGIELISGGGVAAEYLGGECRGHAAAPPDYRVHWSGRSAELRVLFVADDVRDTTLIVNLPDGSWSCNDDASGLDPIVALPDPAPGRYDIWVGSYEAGAFATGTLLLTERRAGDPASTASRTLDHTADPFSGVVELRAGFRPDPHVASVVAGGSVDVSYLGGDCVGFAAGRPDVGLLWRGASDELVFLFAADDDEDTTLAVRLPDGSWLCNDDAVSLDPAITVENPPAGQYAIWVASYGPDQYISGALGITEMKR